MAGIFISYRREDSAGHTGRLMDELTEGFESQQIFRDIEAIEAGADFVEAINQAVASCTAMLVVIGPRWLKAQGPSGKRRLDDRHDFVRLEIEAALAREVRIIPVLVGDAPMPSDAELPDSIKPLARRQAHEISDRRWRYDVEQLFTALAKIPGVAGRKAKPAVAAPPKRGMSTISKVVLGTLAVLGSLTIIGALTQEDSQTPVQPAASTSSFAPQLEQQAAVVTPRPLQSKPPAAPSRAQPAPRPAEPVASPESVTPAAPIVARETETSAPPVAPQTLTGNWRSADGDALYLEQSGNTLAVMALDSGGMHGFMGEGQVHGQRVELTLLHLQSGGTLSMQMTVSPDGRRMSGTARENLGGTSQNLVLMRE